MPLSPLTWHNERRRVGDLSTWDINPRKISALQQKHLRESIEKFNYAEPIMVNTNNMVVGGHQRLAILRALNRHDEEIDVRVPNRPLTDEEFKELALRLNRNQGDWDWDLLETHFSTDELLSLGFEMHEFGLHNDTLEIEDVESDSDVEQVQFTANKNDGTVVFEVFMKKSNRDIVTRALNVAKGNGQNVYTTEEALIEIVKFYLENNSEAV